MRNALRPSALGAHLPPVAALHGALLLLVFILPVLFSKGSAAAGRSLRYWHWAGLLFALWLSSFAAGLAAVALIRPMRSDFDLVFYGLATSTTLIMWVAFAFALVLPPDKARLAADGPELPDEDPDPFEPPLDPVKRRETLDAIAVDIRACLRSCDLSMRDEIKLKWDHLRSAETHFAFIERAAELRGFIAGACPDDFQHGALTEETGDPY